jgi:hypothetical protein
MLFQTELLKEMCNQVKTVNFHSVSYPISHVSSFWGGTVAMEWDYHSPGGQDCVDSDMAVNQEQKWS